MKIEVNNIKLFFDVYGSKLNVMPSKLIEKPTLIVLHGGPGMVDHSLYVEFWSQFSSVAQVIFLDQRGCGRSDNGNKSDWNLKQWGKDIFDFCNALNINKPIIAGISWGGHTLCSYATQYPTHPGGLIFCNTEAHFNLANICQRLEALGGKAASDAARANFSDPSPESTQHYIDICVPLYAKNAYSPQEIGRCIQNIAVCNHYSQNELLDFNYLDHLSNIQCPTLFMVGKESPIHTLESATEMANRINNQLVHFKTFDAGAPVYKDSPEESFNVVLDFINHLIRKEA